MLNTILHNFSNKLIFPRAANMIIYKAARGYKTKYYYFLKCFGFLILTLIMLILIFSFIGFIL